MAKAGWKVIIGQSSLDELAKNLSLSIEKSGAVILREFVKYGLDVLRELERSRDREGMAMLWGTTSPRETADGSLVAEIRSKAEGMTFFAKNAKGERDQRYPVSGKDLLRFLEYGTPAHVISPRDDGGKLAFDTPTAGFKANRLVPNIGIEQKANNRIDKGFLMANMVNHPGIRQSRHLRITKMLMEKHVQSMADDFAREMKIQWGGR